MHITENVSLSAHSTMKLGGTARYLAEINSEQDIIDLISFAKEKNLDYLMIGQGSNIVWKDEGYPGLVIVNKIRGQEVINKDGSGATIRLASGENWDETVVWTIDQGLSGLEFLSKIPGNVGAAPVQNIGAYGAELADSLIEVHAYDTQTDAFGSIAKDACGFGYRTSRFKIKDKGRFFITGITLRLHFAQPRPPFYESLQTYIEEHKITEINRHTIRKAVMAIRAIKLPDPSVVANNGSFFINPVVDSSKLEEIRRKYPEIKSWPMYDGFQKISAGWMIEQAGFKDMHDSQSGMATWRGSALVLVNEHARSTNDLLMFKNKIVNKVRDMFGVTLEQEPELLP